MGYPYAVTVGADSARVLFLRGSELWLLDLADGTRRRIADGPVDAYAADRDARIAAIVRDGELFRADLIGGTLTRVHTAGPVHDARPDPPGTRIGYVTDPRGAASLHVTGPEGDRLLAGEPGNAWREHGGTIAWGVPGAAASEFGRDRGWWWAPDGTQILAVRSARTISLHLLDLDYGWVDVHWDRETYPHLAQVRWAGGGPLITVLRRMQQHGLVLSIDPRTGETQVHAELADARWVEPIPGTPRHLPDGRVLVGGELAHDGFDARCLFADGSLLTPPGLYVRRVAGTLPRADGPAGSPDLIVEGSPGDPAVREIFRVRTSLGGGGPEIQRIAGLSIDEQVTVGGTVLIAGDRVWHAGRLIPLGSPPPPPTAAPVLQRVTDRRLPAGVLYPSGHVAGARLPVLVTMGDGPGWQQVLADPGAWRERQRWADSGFAVVSIDSRGTPGVSPGFEKAVHRRLTDVMLSDQVDALRALHGKHPDLDLSRVAARGDGLGGWLAAMAVLRRPEVFHRAVARQPVLDWADLPAAFAERYLGDRNDSPDVYAHHSLRDGDGSPDVLLVGAELPGFSARPAATIEEELTFLHGW